MRSPGGHIVRPRQAAEDERAKSVLVFAPEDAVFLNCLHPAGALYEQPISQAAAAAQHKQYQELLMNHGIEVFEVSRVMANGNRAELEEFAGKCLKYVLDGEGESEFTTDAYKKRVMAALTNEELVRVCLEQPEVHLRLDPRNTGIETTDIRLHPVGNCVFTRDQQITTQRGVVMCNFAATQRKPESAVLEFALSQLGITPIGRISDAPNATMEGGDFVVLTPDTCALGIGLRSNYAAALHLMRHDLLGSRRFLVVKDVFDHSQDRMHLDCTFSPLHRRLAVVDETILEPSRQRFVDEYIRLDHYDETLQSWYRLRRANVEFGAWLESNGYAVIKLPHECQLAYGCNMLHLGFICGKYRVLTVHEESKRFIESAPEFREYCAANKCQIELNFVPFRSITSMYGSLHCASQVLERAAFESDSIVRDGDAVEGAEGTEASFDYLVKVPTFCGREDLVRAVQKRSNELLNGGASVLFLNKYWADKAVFKGACGCASAGLHSVQCLIKNSFCGAEADPKALTVDDCVQKLK